MVQECLDVRELIVPVPEPLRQEHRALGLRGLVLLLALEHGLALAEVRLSPFQYQLQGEILGCSEVLAWGRCCSRPHNHWPCISRRTRQLPLQICPARAPPLLAHPSQVPGFGINGEHLSADLVLPGELLSELGMKARSH